MTKLGFSPTLLKPRNIDPNAVTMSLWDKQRRGAFVDMDSICTSGTARSWGSGVQLSEIATAGTADPASLLAKRFQNKSTYGSGDLFITRDEDIAGWSLALWTGLSSVTYEAEVQPLLGPTLRRLVVKVIEQAKDEASQLGMALSGITVRRSKSLEDPDFDQIVVDAHISTQVDAAFHFWERLGDRVSAWKMTLPLQDQAILNEKVSVHVQW